MVTEDALVTSALQGIVISLIFAFAILLLTTGNIVISLFATYCVSITVLSVVAIIVLRGWQLGISESISVVILIGLSVDYVVHLAADYSHSSYKNRADKISQAYREMGISILSGMITSAGSGSVLFATVLLLF